MLIFCEYFKSKEDVAHNCPVASGGSQNSSAVLLGSSIAQKSPVPSSSATNGQPLTVIAALPSTGIQPLNNFINI